MPPVEAPQPAADPQPEPESIAKPLVGIIYPPPEVRNIVDKTASFVARNGPSFEERIKGNEIDNPKFNFLTPSDPYHAYYQHKVKEFGEGKGTDPGAPSLFRSSAIPRLAQEAAKIILEPIVPKEAPPEPEFIADPPSISGFDLDVVKLTAQFVARNGKQFLTTLMNKEQRNYQFDFLRPQHSLFNYFTKLVEQYTKVLIPPKDLTDRLKREANDPKEVLKQVNDRVLWARHQAQEKRKVEEKKEKERVAYAQIDWHDFVVVETVDYQPNEMGHFPSPTTPDEVGARVLMQERYDNDPEAAGAEEEEEKAAKSKDRQTEKRESKVTGDDVEMELSDKEDGGAEDMEEASDDEEEVPAPPKPPVGQPPMPAGQPALPATNAPVIVRQYDPKQNIRPAPPSTSDQYLVSPLTNEKIPAHKLQEHMKISLLDPKWREQKERQMREKKEQETVYDTGVNIDHNLRGIAERRTDIFGVGGEETEIGRKIGEEEGGASDHVVWDGHSASMDKVSQQARAKYTIEDQIMSIHQTKGLLEDESKSRIGPSSSKSGPPPPQPPQPPLMRSVAMPVPPPHMHMPRSQPTAVPPPPNPVAPAPQVLRLPPQGVPAPQGLMLAPRPPMMMMQQAPQPMLRPTHMLGMPMPPMAQMGGLAGVPQVIHRPVMPPAPVVVQQMAPVPSHMMDEPPSKKAKTEESLIPEHQWLHAHPNPVMVTVQVPRMPDKPEWNLNAQTLMYTMSPMETCASIKAKIADDLNMPAGKQKLQYEGLFIKDSNTLAFYNFMPSSLVHLTTKERGGRKK